MIKAAFRRITGLTAWRADLAALLAGALAALALPPLYIVPALLVAIPVLLCLIQAAATPIVAFRRGWWFGFSFYCGGLYWITEAILFEADQFWWLVPLAVPALAAVVSLLYVAIPAAIARYARPGWPTALTFAGAWTLFDLVRQFFATGFPWNPLGSVWEFPGYPGDVMIQAAALVGVHGMTLATLLMAASPLLGWRWRSAAALLLAAWCGFGVLRLDQPMPPAPDLTVLLVQGNVAQGQKWNITLMRAIFRRYLDLTQDAVTRAEGRKAVVVWPETASPAQLETDLPARAAIESADDGDQALIGAVRFDANDRPRNSLFALGAGGVIEGIYDKWHLVPFGEYQPSWLPPALQFIPGDGFAPGPGPETLRLPGLPPVGALICYEAIFSSQIVNESDRPDWLVNVTNDAWFGNSSGPRQHLAAVRLRAVEEGLPLMRAANTGITAGFDARGHELGRLAPNTAGTLALALPASLPRTIYGRAGLFLPAGLGFVTLVAGLLGCYWQRS